VENQKFPLEEIVQRAAKALVAHNTEAGNAETVARALVLAEADGQKGHGLSRLPSYCAQAMSGKVDGQAKPRAKRTAAAACRVDASHGFAYPALDLARNELAELATRSGIAAAAVYNSHHCGVAGHHVEALARQGFLGLLFANTPKAIAPWGGKEAVFGTNPVAFAAPRSAGREPLVIDLSLSKVARGKIMFADQEGRDIPGDWALDADGNPTTDPKSALEGTMLPMGDAKGAALVLMVEILASVVTGAQGSFQASSFFTAEGAPPGVGQLLIACAPGPLSGNLYDQKMTSLVEAILSQENTRLPGLRRFELREQAQEHGLELTPQQYEQLTSLGGE